MATMNVIQVGSDQTQPGVVVTKLLAALVSELGKLVTNDSRQFALEVLDRTAGKLPGPVQL
jgi:hypothetical protein